MTFSADDIDKVSHLARLEVQPEQSAFFASQFDRIMDLINQMSQVDTSSVEPMSHPLDMTLRLREDRVTDENRRDEYQKIAPAAENGLYLVPRVIE